MVPIYPSCNPALRREFDNEWLMILGGGLSVLFGVILAVLPGAGFLSLTWLIGAYALVVGGEVDIEE